MSEQSNGEKEEAHSDDITKLSVTDNTFQQNLNESQEKVNSFDQNPETANLNASQSQNQAEDTINSNSIKQGISPSEKAENINQNPDEESIGVVKNSSSLFEFPTDLQPIEKKDNFSFFGGFLDQGSQKTSDKEKIDSNNSLSGLFNNIQSDNKDLNVPEKVNTKEENNEKKETNSSTFSFPTSNQEKDGNSNKEEITFFGGFNDQNLNMEDQFKFSDTFKETPNTSTNQEQVNNDLKEQKASNQGENNNNNKEEKNSEPENNNDINDFKFSGYDPSVPNSSGFGFDFNSGIISSDNNSSFSFKFDFPSDNGNHGNSSGDFTFTPNSSNFPSSTILTNEATSSNMEKNSSDKFTFNPFNSNSSIDNGASGRIHDYFEALNSPVFENQPNESFNAFFNKNDSGDSLEAAYKLLFINLPSKYNV